MSSEAKNTTNQFLVLQADYAANGAAYYGIQRLDSGFRNGTESLSVGETDVTLNAVGDTSLTVLTVTAQAGNVEREIEITFRSRGIEELAILTEGNVYSRLGVLNEAGRDSADLMVSNADTIPSMNTDSLFDIATDQGHVYGGNVSISGGTVIPAGQSSFYLDGDPANGPNVTWITGNLLSTGQGTLYGIIVVLGDVELRGNAHIEGVLLCPNPTTTVFKGTASDDKIDGGIVTRGDIDGTGWPTVQHNPEYMSTFADYETGDYRINQVVSWEFQ